MKSVNPEFGTREGGRSAGDGLCIDGVVEHGDARGRSIGFPTANISVADLDIQDGVWAGTVRLGMEHEAELYAAAVSVGRRPTYYSKGVRLLEAHLLGYTGDLYGRRVLVTLHSRIRPQRRFRDTEELVVQIRKDVDLVRRLALGGAGWGSSQGHEGGVVDGS